VGANGTSDVNVAGVGEVPKNGQASGLTWPASGLRHGLVLRNANGEERLFANHPAKDQWAVQTVAPDRKTAGEPWSTLLGSWSPDEWTEAPPVDFAPALPRYDQNLKPPASAAKAPAAPKAKTSAVDRTVALPGLEDVAPKPNPIVGEYAPDDAQFKAWLGGIKRHAQRDVTEVELRSCFVQWQTEHGLETLDNPKSVFWAHAKTAFAPVTTK
jgi:hypothetical protein